MMNTITHSQAAAQGDLGSVAATAGRIARINTARALKASEKALFDGALQAIRSVTLTPERAHQLMATINSTMEADPQYLPGSGNYFIRCAILESFCAIDEEVNPPVPDEAESRAEAAADAADSRRDRERDEVGA